MKNRTIIGILCIIIAAAVTFGISPFVNKFMEGKVKTLVVAEEIPQGAEISESNVSIVELAKSAVPENALHSMDDAIGLFAGAKMFPGDIVTKAKLTEDNKSVENMLWTIEEGKVAMSVTIKNLAAGLSGKLTNGDIISFYVTDKDGKTVVPELLKYVKVITTTTSGGVDEVDVVPNDDGTKALPATVTVLVAMEQASALANADKNATLHFALVCRGDDKKAAGYLKEQEDIVTAAREAAEAAEKDKAAQAPVQTTVGG